MRICCLFRLIFVAFISTCRCATTYDIEVKTFLENTSNRYYRLYDEIVERTFATEDSSDLDVIFSALSTIQKIAEEMLAMAREAKKFELEKVNSEELKNALTNLRRIDFELFILGKEYFESVLINFIALKNISFDKDIEAYAGGTQAGELLSYTPDIESIFQRSNNTEELKYYWETWREKNLIWLSINFYSIVDAFKKAATMLDISVLEYWYRFYKNKQFALEIERVMQEIEPFYKEFHAFVRHELHKKYGGDIIDANGPIPDHLFQQVLQQAWTDGSIIESYFPYKELPPYNQFVKHFNAEQLFSTAEDFYKSMGFDPLPEQFYKERMRIQNDTESECRTNIVDMTPKFYLQYCPNVSFKSFMQAHGNMAHLHYAQEKQNLPSYYFGAYDLEYPVGEAIILAACTPKHLSNIGLVKQFNFTEQTMLNRLLRMGIHTMFNIPLYFVHNKVMADFLEDAVEKDALNRHYWKLMEKYAGVEPPNDRAEEALDFPPRFYLDLEENHQTKKIVSEVLGYQFYRALCKRSGQAEQLQNCDFYGIKAAGEDLKAMMSLGSSKSLNTVIAKLLPEDAGISANALLDYYAPLLNWLKIKNAESKVKIGWNASKKKVI